MEQIEKKEAMHILSLPNELFVFGIFPYLHSTDLLRAFGIFDNRRLMSLLRAYICHLDLTTQIDLTNDLRHFHWNRIQSLRINESHLNDEIFSTFSMLDRLDLAMISSTTRSISSHHLSLLIQLRKLHLSFAESERLSIDNRFASYIWHPENRVQYLSISNCVILNGCHFLPSSSLVPNRYLTHLSLDVANATSTIPFMSLLPALEHLEIRLRHVSSASSAYNMNFVGGQEWPRRVKYLRLIAHDRLIRTWSLCEYIQRFASSLERLSFYAHLPECWLMQRRRQFERRLLDHLPNIKQLDFCVHSGLASIDIDYRRTFDKWAYKQHVISVYHSHPGTHTRFTLPFVFDRLERVSNDFVDFHSNEYRSNFVLTFPLITSISFYANEQLNLKLFTLIQRACPRLRQMDFKRFCYFHDDLIEDTQLTLPNVRRLFLGDFGLRTSNASLQCLFRLIPNLEYLTVGVKNISTILYIAECQYKRFDTIRQVIIVEYIHRSIVNREAIVKYFPNASVIYRRKTLLN